MAGESASGCSVRAPSHRVTGRGGMRGAPTGTRSDRFRSVKEPEFLIVQLPRRPGKPWRASRSANSVPLIKVNGLPWANS
jgi:hypothetical protein